MESLIGCTLYSRVNPDATCKILAVSPDKSDSSNQQVYFCEISEWGKTDFRALTETEIQKYYNKENNQDLVTPYEHLIEQAMRMSPDRISISEIRGAEEAESFLKAINSGHDGVITTFQSGISHDELTNRMLEYLKRKNDGAKSFIMSGMTATGMTTLARLDPEPDLPKRVLFIEDTRETGGINIIDPDGDAGSDCKCRQRAMFMVNIYGQETKLCQKCLASLGKSCIDALM